MQKDLIASIIVVGYNNCADLKICFSSVLENSSDNVEVVFVDNNSTDHSADEIGSLFPDIKIIRSSQNRGFGAGCNLGAENANGKYLVFLNPDTAVSPGWLEELISPLVNDEKVGMTTSKILQYKYPEKINTCGNDVHLSGLAMCRGIDQSKTEFSQPCDVNSVSGACFAISKEFFSQLNGFDETYFLYVEDTDISLRCLLNGKSIRYVPTSIIYHNYILKFGPRKTYYQERNRLYMIYKVYTRETLHALKLALLLVEFITLGFCVLNGKKDIENFRNAHKWLNENKEIIACNHQKTQELRRVSDFEIIKHLSWKIDFAQTSGKFIAFLISCFFYPFLFLAKNIAFNQLKKIHNP